MECDVQPYLALNSVSVDLASGLYGDPHHPALPDPSAHQPMPAMPAMPEGATNVMDTTFYYALYLVLFIGTLIGNFFLVCIQFPNFFPCNEQKTTALFVNEYLISKETIRCSHL